MCVCVLVCVCKRERKIDKREKDKEKKRRKEGKEKKQRTWKKFRVSCLSSNQMQNGKENHCISKLNKEQLTRYIQALSKTVTHTAHTTHTSFHLLTPSLSFILPSLPLFFFQRLANVSMRACVQLPRDHKGATVSRRERMPSPLLSGSSLFSRISFASVPSSIRSSLVITPMVLKPVVSHGTENNINTNMQKQNSITNWNCSGATKKNPDLMMSFGCLWSQIRWKPFMKSLVGCNTNRTIQFCHPIKMSNGRAKSTW